MELDVGAQEARVLCTSSLFESLMLALQSVRPLRPP
jgi:hypothetical protein